VAPSPSPSTSPPSPSALHMYNEADGARRKQSRRRRKSDAPFDVSERQMTHEHSVWQQEPSAHRCRGHLRPAPQMACAASVTSSCAQRSDDEHEAASRAEAQLAAAVASVTNGTAAQALNKLKSADFL